MISTVVFRFLLSLRVDLLNTCNFPLQQCDHAGLDTDVVTIGADEHVADGKNLQPVKEKVG